MGRYVRYRGRLRLVAKFTIQITGLAATLALHDSSSEVSAVALLLATHGNSGFGQRIGS